MSGKKAGKDARKKATKNRQSLEFKHSSGYSSLVIQEGFEPPTHGLEARFSRINCAHYILINRLNKPFVLDTFL